MARAKKKFESGAATAFMSRNQAIKKLQLSLKDFRRLCILKGIYPREPKHKKRVGKGNTAPKTYYLVKDIQFLAHEPVINKFREFKHFMRRLRKATEKRETDAIQRIKNNRPKYKLDHIVKERYPTFLDSVRDMDDSLSMCSLFATFPKSSSTHTQYIQMSRRLSVEFMHYVIASKSLRKVFVSIKGIYLQAEVMNQTVTWVVPHARGYESPTEVDYKIMETFTEFYTTLLGFINFRLYNSLNLYYPPKLDGGFTDKDYDEEMGQKERLDEKLSALTQSLQSIDEGGGEDEPEIDDFPIAVSEDPDHVEQVQVEAEKMKKFMNLFKGLKIFLNREVPKEILTFVIRSFGGEVSFCKTLGLGATFQEEDETITHQIVDRPTVTKQYLSRFYVQPQWIFDSVNARTLLPMEDYFIGAMLPPHLSPFVEEQEGDYVPPEKQTLLDRQQGVENDVDEEESEDEDNEEDELESDDEQENEEEEEDNTKKGKKRKQEEQPTKSKKKKDDVNTSTMSVEAGTVEEEDVNRKLSRQQAEERKLAEMMIPKKKKRLYERIMTSKRKKTQEAKILSEKRQSIDLAQKKDKKKKKRT